MLRIWAVGMPYGQICGNKIAELARKLKKTFFYYSCGNSDIFILCTQHGGSKVVLHPLGTPLMLCKYAVLGQSGNPTIFFLFLNFINVIYISLVPVSIETYVLNPFHGCTCPHSWKDDWKKAKIWIGILFHPPKNLKHHYYDLKIN